MPLGPGGSRGGIARAPARQGPYPEPIDSVFHKLHRYEVHTRQTTDDHDPRRTGQSIRVGFFEVRGVFSRTPRLHHPYSHEEETISITLMGVV